MKSLKDIDEWYIDLYRRFFKDPCKEQASSNEGGLTCLWQVKRTTTFKLFFSSFLYSVSHSVNICMYLD